ncbi:MAG: hypothetical protein U0325_03830 [Polyangiales bacterium]
MAFDGAQTPPQPPRIGSFIVSTSHPFSAMPSQSAKPGLQVKPRRPAVHVGAALARVGQAIPQPPQWAGSVKVLTSQPLRAMRSQSP